MEKKTPDIHLRLLTLDDVTETYVSWLNDPEVNKYLDTHGTTLEELRKYVGDRLGKENCRFFGIVDTSFCI